MNKHFLVGNFLRAYSGSYRYPKHYANPNRRIDPEWLEVRLATRAARSESRKRSHLTNMQMSMAMALLLMIGATTLDIRPGSGFDISVTEQETVDLQEITQTVQQQLPPPPPRPSVPIVVPDDEELEETTLDLDATLDLADAISALPPPPPVVAVAEEEDEPEIFVIVEEMPEIIGGTASLAKSVQYPSIARQAGIEGTVVVKVVVTASGNPESPEVLKSPSEVLDKAAIEAVMKQKFKPGKQRGRAVPTYMAIPVRFRLTG